MKLILIVFLAITILNVNGQVILGYFNKLKDITIPSISQQYLIKSIKTIEKTNCLTECNSDTTCISVTYQNSVVNSAIINCNLYNGKFYVNQSITITQIDLYVKTCKFKPYKC